jgi:hypothetical protein
MELNTEFTIWYGSNYGGKCPGPKDLHEYMDKEFGKQRDNSWRGVKIMYDRDKFNTETEYDSNGDIDENDLA